MYEVEERFLLKDFSDIIFEALSSVKAWIAGGAITSVFCNREINDYDLYFGSAQDLYDFLMQLEGTEAQIINQSDKSLTILSDDKLYQAVFIKYYESAKDIFKDFDFTICMGAYNPRKSKFILHPEFLHHNSLRILKFNPGTAYPLVSVLRVAKYKEKGYTISKLEMCKMLLTVNKLKLDSFEEVTNHFGGMYGLKPDQVFSAVQDKPFSVTTALQALDEVETDVFTEEKHAEIGNFKQFCQTLTGIKIKCFKTNLGFVGVYDCDIYENPEKIIELPAPEFVYKFVQKLDNKYFSIVNNKFEYIFGEVVEAQSNYYKKGLYFSTKNLLNKNCYLGQNHANKVLIECEFYPEEVVQVSSYEIVVNKSKMIREVPEDEWKGWLKE